MNRLIKLQLRNIFYNKLFYVCLILNLFMSPIVKFIMSLTTKTSSAVKVLPEFQSFISSEIGLISMLFITLFCTFDFTEGTVKNIIGRGYNVSKLLISKYIASFIGLLCTYGISFIVIFVLYIKNGLGYEASMPLVLTFSIFKILSYIVLYATIAFILEKTSSAIIANLFFPSIVSLALDLADSKLHANISKIWIDNIGTKFLEKPILSNMSMPIIMYIIYIVLVAIIGIQIVKVKEIK